LKNNVLEKDFLDMLQLFSFGAKEITGLKMPEDYNLKGIVKYAQSQSAMPLVYAALRAFKEKNDVFSDEDVKQILALEKMIFIVISKELKSKAYFDKIIKKLEAENIKYAILKGDSISCLYKNPDMRLSGDFDIYVDSSDEERTLEIVREFGYDTSERAADSNESSAVHKSYKMIEIHVSLHDKSREDLYFNKAHEKLEEFRKFKVPDFGEYNTLSIDDGLMFLFTHFTKHFLSEGAGIRQVMDLLLYIEKYRQRFRHLFK